MHAYIGTNSQHAPNSVSRVYGGDKSGIKTYRFNSLGYRGDEPQCGSTVFVCGCSHTFGTGLDWEETWAYQFNQYYKADCLMNFSQGGGSNQYIARTLITQCERVKPKLVIAHFTISDRTEYFSTDSVIVVGRWVKDYKPEIQRRIIYKKVRGFSDKFYDNFCNLRTYYDALTQMLLLQSYCQANGIPLIIMWFDHKQIKDSGALKNAVINQMYDMVNITPIAINDFKLDLAADNCHHGIRSHEALSNAILKSSSLTQIDI